MNKFLERFRHFMIGRYGVDQLSIALIISSLIIGFIVGFIPIPFLSLFTFIPIILCYIRIFSKNIAKRRIENQKFLKVWYPAKHWFIKKKNKLVGLKTYKYYKCPQCKQELRVPRGKGNIRITCPKCKHEFRKRT